MAQHQVTIRDRSFDLSLPPLDLREDLVYSYGEKWRANRAGLPVQRVCAAMLALCVPEVAFGLRPEGNPREDLYAFGGSVYNALRAKGWTPADLLRAGDSVVSVLLAETFPREAEVKEAQGN